MNPSQFQRPRRQFVIFGHMVMTASPREQYFIEEFCQHSPSFLFRGQGILDGLGQETRTAAETDICQLAFFKFSFIFMTKDSFFLS